MSPVLRVSLLLLALTASACTRAGGRCDTDGFRCEDPETALECRDNVWEALPCRGPAGCTVDG
ncbi:MAG: hypothetical protein L0Y64_03650, partial [Myxococcaceae bacterium]|nr:hypothetical protein [Myxococcaceae bacterium]